MRFLVAVLTVMLATEGFAQSGYGTTTVYDTGQKDLPTDSAYYVLPANAFWHKQPWKDSVYRFDEFQLGRLEFANGFSPSTRMMMNYNIFLESISVLDKEGGVSLLKKFPELKFIHIGDHKFYYVPDLGYLEIVLEGKISVAKRTVMASVFETSNGFKYRMTGMDVKTQTNKYTRYYWPVELYFILDPDHKLHRPGTFVLPQMLPDLKDRIKDFVSINKINYRKPDDVIKVVKFCNENFTGVYVSAKAHDILKAPIGTDLVHSKWRDSVYRFPSFEETTFTYEDGSREAIVVNYNYLKGRFEKITETGDTVLMRAKKPIRLSNTDGVMFLHDHAQGPVEVIMQGVVGLGVKKKISLQPRTYADTVSTWTIERTWFFLDKNKAVPANARAILSLFPSHKVAIKKYISTYNPDFDSEADLVNLLGYCSSL